MAVNMAAGTQFVFGNALRLWDEALLLQIAPSQQERNLLAAFESSVARQHGIGDEEPSTLNIQEQAKRRGESNVAGNLHGFELVASHGFARLGRRYLLMQTHQHGEHFDRIGHQKRAASMAAPNALRDEAFVLRKPAKHLNRHGLARSEYSRRHRHAVGRDENAAVSNIEENAERCGLINHTGDRDEVVLAGHHMDEVRTIPCNGK